MDVEGAKTRVSKTRLVIVFGNFNPSVANRDGYISRIRDGIASAVFGLWIVEDILNFHSGVLWVVTKLKNLALLRVQTAQLEAIPGIITTRVSHISESL